MASGEARPCAVLGKDPQTGVVDAYTCVAHHPNDAIRSKRPRPPVAIISDGKNHFDRFVLAPDYGFLAEAIGLNTQSCLTTGIRGLPVTSRVPRAPRDVAAEREACRRGRGNPRHCRQQRHRGGHALR